MIRITFAAATILLLSGCVTAEPSSSESIELVKERYADCLEDLNATQYSTKLDSVEVKTDAGLLVFEVGKSNTGDVLTVPATEFTINALTSVGC